MQNLLVLAVSIILHATTRPQFRGHRGTMGAVRILLHGTWRLSTDSAMHPPRDRPSDEVSIVPSTPDPSSGKIDKSALAIAEPRRLRDKAHLKFIAAQPCLICGRQPSDPHHLRFAQPRALGLKVSDEFTVPLCRGHHRQLHQAGNEIVWWEGLQHQRTRDRQRALGRKPCNAGPHRQ